MDKIEQPSELQDEIAVRVNRFVLDQFPLARRRRMDANSLLVDEGIIDSMGVLELVTFIETEFHVILTDEDVVADNFQSVGSIVKFIRRKLEPALALPPRS